MLIIIKRKIIVVVDFIINFNFNFIVNIIIVIDNIIIVINTCSFTISIIITIKPYCLAIIMNNNIIVIAIIELIKLDQFIELIKMHSSLNSNIFVFIT